MRLQDVICAVTLLSVVAPAGARAQQRPLVTQDPETVGANRVLVEAGVELGRDQLYSAYGLKGDTTRGAMFGVSVGLSPTAEIEVDGGLVQRLYVKARTAAPLSQVLDFIANTASSLEDLTLATKVRLTPETERRPGFGVRFGTKLPTAKRERGMGLGTTDFFAAFLLGKTVESVRTVGNVSLLVLGNPVGAQQPVHAIGFGLSVARAVTNDFELVGEVNGHLNPAGPAVPPGTESRGVLRLATRYTHKLLRVDLGILFGITPRDPAFGISAGATYVIGK